VTTTIRIAYVNKCETLLLVEQIATLLLFMLLANTWVKISFSLEE
jgi:hypothetical protein